jgi:hypothetical protein
MNRTTLVLSSIVTTLLFLSSCDKDIRNRYTGDWEFLTKIDSAQFDYEINEWIQLGFDTIAYFGNITQGKNNDELIIRYTEQNEVTAWVNHNGNIWTPIYSTSTGSRHGYFEEKDKIYLNLSYFKYGGFLTNHYIEGNKKERRKK